VAYRKRRPIKQRRDRFDALAAEDKLPQFVFLLRRPRRIYWWHYSIRRLVRGLTPHPVGFEAFVVFLEFWLGLTVRYRLSRRHWIESPSTGLVCDLLRGGSLRLHHFPFAFSPSSTRRGARHLPSHLYFTLGRSGVKIIGEGRIYSTKDLAQAVMDKE
jgi:hypothetical protein